MVRPGQGGSRDDPGDASRGQSERLCLPGGCTGDDQERNEKVTRYLYVLQANDRYPDPAEEISALAALVDNGVEPGLLLADRKSPPMKRASAGDEVILAVRDEGRGRGSLRRPAGRRARRRIWSRSTARCAIGGSCAVPTWSLWQRRP